MPRRIRVVAGLFLRDGQVLVQQRPMGKARALLWEFPGGKVEPGETDAEALVRECKEELGVAVQVGKVLWRDLHNYDDLTVDLTILAAEMECDAQPQALDAHHLKWAQLDELTSLPFCEADRSFLANIRAILADL